jgi:hypothetical protein
MNATGEMFPIERSNLYTAWLMEKQAILEHKWYMSEKAGYDVGYETAKWDWDIAGHRKKWVSDMKSRGAYPG